MNLNTFLKHIGNDNSGATAIEYGLIIACIALALVASLNSYSAEVNDMWNGVEEDVLNAAGQGVPPTD